MADMTQAARNVYRLRSRTQHRDIELVTVHEALPTSQLSRG